MTAQAYGTSQVAHAVVAALKTCVAAFDDASGELVFANDAFMHSFLPADAMTMSAESFVSSFAAAAPLSARAGAHEADADQDQQEWRHLRSGTWFAIRRYGASVSGRTITVVELSDISQQLRQQQARRSQQQQLLFTSKVMSVGEMAATLAHELNQPIGSLLNFLNGCLMRLDRKAPPESLREVLAESRQQCERAASIITRIREFVRTREPKMAPLDVGAMLRTVATLLEAEIRHHQVQLRIEVQRELPIAMADAVMIEQVMHNITKNAIEAMREQAGARRLLLRAEASEAGQIEVSVTDSGPGVPEAARDQLFSPFFSTKPDGLGIGLNICRSLIEFHGGSLYYTHPRDGGCRFCFTLPISSAH
jgi:hypothetical protein